MSKEMVVEYETKRLCHVRVWCLIQVSLMILMHTHAHLSDEYNTVSVLYKYFHWTITFFETIGVYQSYCNKIKSIYWTLMLIQFQDLLGYAHSRIISKDNVTEQLSSVSFFLMFILWNNQLIFLIFNKWRLRF